MANTIKPLRKLMQSVAGIHSEALLPQFHSDTLQKRAARRPVKSFDAVPTAETKGKVALFGTCYGNRNEPEIGEDMIAVFEHNGIPVKYAEGERCCGMPKLELGDLQAVREAKEVNIPLLAGLVDQGYDIIAPVPSCVLMFKQELPLMFPNDPQVQKVKAAMFDPFEYLMLRHKDGKLKTNFATKLGKIAYQIPCHLRVQNVGQKTREILQLVPDTKIDVIERCSGHDGTYAVKAETHELSMKILKPVVGRVQKAEANYYSSDCPMAGRHIQNGLRDGTEAVHPMSLLRKAYGI